ncbi:MULTISPECIES: EAL domain-containing protein [Thiorhodovibrio]|uniref:EAL domain-containing protein n=1 Tax=Thiorhodovibrio TaxID=61593 RepID=UPI0019116E50|nr:EAL domain-containing protein [Thiorhodovibrio litoralis]WPL11883.1 Bacteriophytochrome cph2 [Thiorhodovibrio litoralis]
MDTNAASDALAYYRTQCDELGARMLRLQQELVQARRDAQRNRTLALVVEQIHALAREAEDEDTFAAHLGEQLLMLLVERLHVEAAALMCREDDASAYRIMQAVGIKPGTRLSLANAPAPADGLLSAQHEILRHTGLETGLWVSAPPSPWSLLLGFRREASARLHPLEPADRIIAEAAIRIYEGLISRQRALAALRSSEANYKALFESAQDAIVVLDLAGSRILDINRRGLDLFGGTLEQLRAQRAYTWLLPVKTLPWRDIWKPTLRGHAQQFEAQIRRANGNSLWVEINLNRIDARPPILLAVVRDITERKRSEAFIHRLAFFDPLTDLPNRRLFLDRLANAQAAAQRTGHIGAVLFLDLDRFKQINDARGHEVGDHLLQHVSERLQRLLRDEDTVARFGGDEFVILLNNLSSGAEEASHFAHRVAEKIRHALAAPYLLKAGELRSEVSIGITLMRGHEASVQDLVREADTALYRAKESGRNCIRFFEPSMQDAAEARFNLEGELRQAIERRELQLYYQPQVDATGRLIGVEALMRWPHAEKGMISPGVFIPVAEDAGLILPMGRWALHEACSFLARAQSAGRRLRMSVNVSPRQFRQADFVAEVKEVLDSSGIPPADLTLELTEGVVIEDIASTIRTMQELKALGVRFSIDDFGTGYSSLTYLKRLPIDELKVDRSFVQDVCTDADDAALVEAILSVCRHLRVSVIAEGVETAEQLQFFRARNCDAYQGFYFGMPLPAETFLATLDLETILPQQPLQ